MLVNPDLDRLLPTRVGVRFQWRSEGEHLHGEDASGPCERAFPAPIGAERWRSGGPEGAGASRTEARKTRAGRLARFALSRSGLSPAATFRSAGGFNASGLASCVALGLLLVGTDAKAEWSIAAESQFYYTDDAALFSSTRRTLKDQDPTQPVIDFDLADQGSDFVYEPVVELGNEFSLLGHETALRVVAQGFVFARNPEFDHPSLAVEVRRRLGERTELLTRYFFIPDLFIGRNEIRVPEEEGGGEGEPGALADEEVTTHFWALGVRRELHERVTATLFGRAGIRRYDASFRQRDTNFFTAGLHVDFEPAERVELALGFHYERGLADGRNGEERLLRDDVSYNNYFATAELELELTERIALEMALHYERNDWTTDIPGDERKGEHEDQFQGDILAVYSLSECLALTAGFQGAYRKESFEDALHNLNTWLGVRVTF